MDIPAFPNERARRIWVKAALETIGSSFAAIAREEGCTAQAISKAMVMPADAAEKAIAAKLKTTQQILFPDRFHPETGERLHVVRKSIDHHSKRNAKAERAA